MCCPIVKIFNIKEKKEQIGMELSYYFTFGLASFSATLFAQDLAVPDMSSSAKLGVSGAFTLLAIFAVIHCFRAFKASMEARIADLKEERDIQKNQLALLRDIIERTEENHLAFSKLLKRMSDKLDRSEAKEQ